MEQKLKQTIKNKLKFVGMLFCLLVLAGALAGCGVKAGDPGADPEDGQTLTGHSDLTARQMLDKVLAATPDLSSSLIDLQAEQITDFYGFTDDLQVESAVKLSSMNVKSNEIGVFKVQNDEDTSSIEVAVDKRMNDAIANWMPGYMPEEITKMENYSFLAIGNFAIYVVADEADQEAALKAFRAEFE